MIPAEPGGDDVGAVARLERDDDAGEDLDDADEVMNSWPVPGAMSLIQGAR